MERKNAWKEYTEAEVSELEKLNESYRKFLDAGKTERECVKQAVAMAEAAGYLDLKKVIEEGKKVKAGDKLYAVNMVNTAVNNNIYAGRKSGSKYNQSKAFQQKEEIGRAHV